VGKSKLHRSAPVFCNNWLSRALFADTGSKGEEAIDALFIVTGNVVRISRPKATKGQRLQTEIDSSSSLLVQRDEIKTSKSVVPAYFFSAFSFDEQRLLLLPLSSLSMYLD